jgi:hypothetical protein
MRHLALLSALSLVVACGSKNDHGAFVDDSPPVASGGMATRPGSGGNGGSSGSGAPVGSAGEAGAGEAGAGGEGATDPLFPVVVISSPAPVLDPNLGPVVVSAAHVVCEVEKGPAQDATLDTSSVVIEAFDAKGVSIKKVNASQSASQSQLFSADFTLTSAAAGKISFECRASDRSSVPRVGHDLLNTFLDQGPLVTVQSPELTQPLTYYPLSSPVLFAFTVAPQPLSDTDAQAAVDVVTLTIDGVPIDLTNAQVKGSTGVYALNLLLSDALQFPKVPNGPVSIAISASNERVHLPADHPTPVTASVLDTFGVDGTGPTIKIVSPAPADATVLGKQVKLEFSVTDAQSQVDPSTVKVTFNKIDVRPYDLTPGKKWSRTGDTFDYLFDTTQVPGSQIQLHVEVAASDNASNPSMVTAADYWLDTKAPILDLDPPALQERKASGQDHFCSDFFDPLGLSPDDRMVVPSTRKYRALVWDDTNSASGQSVFHFSGVDPTTVQLYAQADPTQPLLADSDGDGVCDKLLVDTTDGVTNLPIGEDLHPLFSAGKPWYEATSPTTLGVCTTTIEQKPDNLCSVKNSDLTRVIDHDIANRNAESVIYTLTSSDQLECTGKDWELSSSIMQNGWVCLAAQASDFAGNHGISAPLRVCLNSDAPGRTMPTCANGSEIPPSCVKDGCTVPAHFPFTLIDQVDN